MWQHGPKGQYKNPQEPARARKSQQEPANPSQSASRTAWHRLALAMGIVQLTQSWVITVIKIIVYALTSPAPLIPLPLLFNFLIIYECPLRLTKINQLRL